MSLEFYFLPYHQGQPASLPRAELRRLFPVVDAESEPDYWRIRYDATHECAIGLTPVDGRPDLVASFCIYRPCAAPRFWNDLLTVLRLGPVALVFPGDAPPIVGSHATVAHLPADVIASMGTPLVADSGVAIANAVATA